MQRLQRKDESNEKLKENNTERNTFRAFQRDGEINDSDTEMQTQNIHTEVEREQKEHAK